VGLYSEYSGYLRRDADIGGFLFWLGSVNNAALRDLNKQHAIVCSFMTSAEYQRRFGAVASWIATASAGHRDDSVQKIALSIYLSPRVRKHSHPGRQLRHRTVFP